ncbi:type IV toxin-antitoxin system AbiEi family antitoxin domain-containing protein [Trujillonella humicola]|uniref:type IV toxin-antitoxin system AbiEi family antitoxin domain-containing protein n=1 Tax=Trujillonella humicola TaxID=3383699 RepID=UPI00390612E8
MEPQPSELVLRRTALAEGWSDDELERRLRRGELTRLRPGAYAPPQGPDQATLRHRQLVTATLAALRRPAVVSHQSAAVVHGLPLWGAPLDRVHVTRRPPASGEIGRHLHCHVARLPDEDVTAAGGVAVTTRVRTALDLARTLPFEPAVAMLDRWLFLRLITAGELADGVADLGRLPGARVALRAVRFADGRSESVGESRSRVLLHRLGLMPSTLQLPIADAMGNPLGRVDFAWEDARVIGEFDGRVKYGRLLRPGQDPGDAVFDEKIREDAIRDRDLGVVRWIWRELTPQALGPRVSRALERGRRRPV